jgi:hypothetical protein
MLLYVKMCEYSFITLIISHQTELLIRHSESSTAMDVEGSDDQDTSAAFQLDKISKVLNMRTTAAEVGVTAAAEAVKQRLQEVRAANPELLDTDLPRILATLPALSPQQKAKLSAVEDMLFKVSTVERLAAIAI